MADSRYLPDLSSDERRNMKNNLWKCLWTQVACLSLWPVLAFAQSPGLAQNDLGQNLEACKAGREICDQSKMSPSQLADLTLVLHLRNVANCRNGYDSCDRSKLSDPEAMALAVADHQRNVSDCNDAMQSCDPSKLTQSESRDSSVAQHRRNISDC